MTNNLKEEIHKAIKTAYELALASNDSDQKKGIDNFYHIHLNPLEYQIDTWLRNLINQKEREHKLEAYLEIDLLVAEQEQRYETLEYAELHQDLDDRIKQLKEELNKGELNK